MKNKFKVQIIQGKEVIYESALIDNSEKQEVQKYYMELINDCYAKAALSCTSFLTVEGKLIIVPRNILMNCIVQLVPIDLEKDTKPSPTKPSSGGQSIP
jgi:hypothetical protein